MYGCVCVVRGLFVCCLSLFQFGVCVLFARARQRIQSREIGKVLCHILGSALRVAEIRNCSSDRVIDRRVCRLDARWTSASVLLITAKVLFAEQKLYMHAHIHTLARTPSVCRTRQIFPIDTQHSYTWGEGGGVPQASAPAQ